MFVVKYYCSFEESTKVYRKFADRFDAERVADNLRNKINTKVYVEEVK